MRRLPLAAALLAAGAAGCTHKQLARSTVDAVSTVMDIQHRSVLMNLAMMSCHPEALPNHANLADGVVQINDEVGVGQSGGFTALGGDFGIERFGPDASRQVTEQWGTDATTDPQRLFTLQALYRAALGLPQLPPPNAITYVREQQGRGRKGGNGKPEGKSGDTSPVGSADGGVVVAQGTTSTGGGGSTPSGDGESNGDKARPPLEVLLSDVPPPGWYHLGCRKDVPKDAVYVARWGDRYCWVTAAGVPELSRFTLTALTVIRLDAAELRGGGGSGLAVTR